MCNAALEHRNGDEHRRGLDYCVKCQILIREAKLLTFRAFGAGDQSGGLVSVFARGARGGHD